MFTVRSELFEGPLDLLLHLVRKQGVDLRQLRVAPLCDDYLAWLDTARDLHLGLAADWLVMAATLCRLKAIELIPRPPTATTVEGEPEDPRQALIRRLVEHQRYKEAAADLDARPLLGRDVFARAPETGEVHRPVAAGLDAFGLLDLYHALIRRASAPAPVHEVAGSLLDLGACCRAVLVRIGGVGQRMELGDILAAFETRMERIVAFLAVLEMARLRWIGIEQREAFGPVEIEGRVAVDVDLSAVIGGIEAIEPVLAAG